MSNSENNNGDYDMTGIIKNSWPAWSPNPLGGWVRRWTFEFKEAIPDASDLSEGLSDSALQVEAVQGILPGELRATTTTTGNHMSDEIFFYAFYRLFCRLEEKFGELKLIQGQPEHIRAR